MKDLALLILRLVTGGLLAGHGAQKIFGWFEGHGIEGTGGWLESMGMRPGKTWAMVAGGAEVTGGALTALGLMNPVGPIVMFGPMATAARMVHWDKPIWVSEGGAELPLMNVGVATALLLSGPGAISLDRILGVRVPWYVSVLVMVATAAGVRAATDEQLRSKLERVPAAAKEALARKAAGDGQSVGVADVSPI